MICTNILLITFINETELIFYTQLNGFKYLSNSGANTEFRSTSFIWSTGVACSDSVKHNQEQMLCIPVLLLACSQDWTSNLDDCLLEA